MAVVLGKVLGEIPVLRCEFAFEWPIVPLSLSVYGTIRELNSGRRYPLMSTLSKCPLMPFSQSALLAHIEQYSAENTWWVALSGGLDSVVLLHSLKQLNLPLKALHINHQLSSNADHWQSFCEDLCRQWGVEFHCEKVAVNNRGRGVEDAARDARYRVFEKYLNSGEVMLTAHHRDDQAETLLLRLMRGAGPKGLGAMAPERRLGRGILVRPLMDYSRAELEVYAREWRLSWIEDESNADTDFDRNFLRHRIMPELEKRWPGFSRRWLQSTELCRETQALAEELAELDLEAAEERIERMGRSLALEALQCLNPPRRAQLLRLWFSRQGVEMPDRVHLREVEQQLIDPRGDSEAEVNWGNVSLRHYRGRLYCLPVRPWIEPAPLIWASAQPLALPGGGCLSAEVVTVAEGQVALRPLVPLEIRWRQGGERCKPVGRPHSQTLKKMLQEYGLEPWLRGMTPLIYSGESLVAVGDLWVCEGFQALTGEQGIRLHWRPYDPASPSS